MPTDTYKASIGSGWCGYLLKRGINAPTWNTLAQGQTGFKTTRILIEKRAWVNFGAVILPDNITLVEFHTYASNQTGDIDPWKVTLVLGVRESMLSPLTMWDDTGNSNYEKDFGNDGPPDNDDPCTIEIPEPVSGWTDLLNVDGNCMIKFEDTGGTTGTDREWEIEIGSVGAIRTELRITYSADSGDGVYYNFGG